MKELISHKLVIETNQFKNFADIIKTGAISRYFENKGEDNNYRQKLFSPIDLKGPKKIYLYYEGEDQIIPCENIASYFKARGYKIINDPHPSLLINSLKQLSNQSLKRIGLPPLTSIILPTSEKNFIFLKNDNHPFILSIKFEVNGSRYLCLEKADIDYDKKFALIVQKISNK